MKIFRFLLPAFCLILLFSESARAQQKITASITVTNATVNGVTLVVNGNTRTFTNFVFNTATQILTNNDVTGCGSKTNALLQIYANPFPQTVSVDTGSNSFNIVGNANLAMSVTLTAGYGTVAYSTQTVANLIGLTGPVSALPTAQARTNVASAIAGALGAVENTNSIPQGSKAASELVGTNNTQTISGAKDFNNTNSAFRGAIVQSLDATNVIRGGYQSNVVSDRAVFTNAVNYGKAFSSPGTNSFSEQFGNAAYASQNGTAVGYGAGALGTNSSAYGTQATASGTGSLAIGNIAEADGEHSMAIGESATASAASAMAIGQDSFATFSNSVAIGVNANTTAPYQIMLGSPGLSTVVQNNLAVQTNLTVGGNAVITGNTSFSGLSTNLTPMGTNNFPANSDIAFTRKSISSLANGNNAAVPIGTNVFIEVSGPSGSFAINGIANGRDGKLITVLNQTGFQMTIANESGSDPTAANRIRTLGSATDLVLTNAACTFIYNGNVSRWILISHNP